MEERNCEEAKRRREPRHIIKIVLVLGYATKYWEDREGMYIGLVTRDRREDAGVRITMSGRKIGKDVSMIPYLYPRHPSRACGGQESKSKSSNL